MLYKLLYRYQCELLHLLRGLTAGGTHPSQLAPVTVRNEVAGTGAFLPLRKSRKEDLITTLTQTKPRLRWQLTERDLNVMLWICRHGLVTAEQVSRRFFPGQRSCYRRLNKLVSLGVLQRNVWRWRHPAVYRVTRSGSSLVSTTVGPAQLIVSQIAHSLALVDLVEDLTVAHPQATLTTERELRGERFRAIHEKRRDAGRGRIPDGQFTFPDGKVVAVELDLTPKRERLYAEIVRAFSAERLHVWWYVPSQETAARLRRVVEREFASSRIEVFVRQR
jgi:hypothetical protein